MLRRARYVLIVCLATTLLAPWARPGAAQAKSFGLLCLASLCLVALEKKLTRRKDSEDSRLAEALASAFRSGIFTFDEPRQPGVPLWRLWVDDEPDPEPKQAVSRYRLLGYQDKADEALEVAVVSVRQFGVAHDALPAASDDLTRGIPREYLKPAAASSTNPAGNAPVSLVEAAAGDDPGEGVQHLDIPARTT